jgi:hypothetical protein
MTLDERTRHALHLRLDEVVGPEHAAAMMTAYDRPFEWGELATKRDLLDLEERLMLRVAAMLHREISGVSSAMNSSVTAIHREISGVSSTMNGSVTAIHTTITTQTRSLVIAVVGAMIANASLTIGALALTR